MLVQCRITCFGKSGEYECSRRRQNAGECEWVSYDGSVFGIDGEETWEGNEWVWESVGQDVVG